MSAPFPRLLGDIGGTNARWGWQAAPGAPIGAIDVRPVSAHASLLDAARDYLARHGHPPPRAAAIGVATPVTGDAVRMTNHPWAFSIRALKASLGVDRLRVLNDFEALALALPALAPSALRPLGHGADARAADRRFIEISADKVGVETPAAVYVENGRGGFWAVQNFQ